MVRREVLYFDEFGSQNTAEAIKAAKKATLDLGLKHVVVASGSGATGFKVAEEFKGSNIRVVVVTEYAGAVEFEEENREKLKELGCSDDHKHACLSQSS